MLEDKSLKKKKNQDKLNGEQPGKITVCVTGPKQDSLHSQRARKHRLD